MKLSRTHMLARAAAAIGLSLCSPPANGEHFFATQVINTVVGGSQSPDYATSAKALGGPVGGDAYSGSYDVYNLGIGGSLTLGFDNGPFSRTISNAPGPDFIVFENPIYAGGPSHSFAELMYVEVSSNGVDFARFPVTSNTAAPVLPLGTINATKVSGFAGVHAVWANVTDPGNNISPFDPTAAGGDAFDLSALANHPLVVSGKVNLNAIRQVRLVDVVGDGRDLDNQTPPHPIYDPTGDGNNGADVDSVAAINGVSLVGSARLIGSAGGSFNDASRWDAGSASGGAGTWADISALDPGATLSLVQAVRLSHLDFGSNSNTLAGPATLILDGGGVGAGITGTAGVHTISAPVEFSGNVVLSGGDGTLIFTGPLIYDDNASITLAGGTIEFAVDQGPVSVGKNVTLSIMGGATLDLGGGNVDAFSDSSTGQAMSMSFVAVPEPGVMSCFCLFGCVLLRRKR